MLGVNKGVSLSPVWQTPQQVGLWIDANNPNLNGTQPPNGTAITSILDASANNFQIMQSTSGQQPTYVTNSLNGKSGLQFNGTSTYLTAPNSSLFNINSTGMTIIAVTTPNTILTVHRIVSATSGSNGWTYGQLTTSGRFSTIGSTDYTQANYWTAGVAQISTITFDSSHTVTFYSNGTGFTPITSGSGAVSTTGSLYIGSRNGISEFWDGIIYEVIIYFSVLSTTDITAITRWLGNKWGIQTV